MPEVKINIKTKHRNVRVPKGTNKGILLHITHILRRHQGQFKKMALQLFLKAETADRMSVGGEFHTVGATTSKALVLNGERGSQ